MNPSLWGLPRIYEFQVLSMVVMMNVTNPALFKLKKLVLILSGITFHLGLVYRPTKSKDSRVRDSKDQCGLVCGTLLPFSFLASVPAHGQYYLVAIAVTTLRAVYCGQNYLPTAFVTSFGYGVLTFMDMKESNNQWDIDRIMATLIPIIQCFLLSSAENTFTHAEAALVAGMMCSTVTTTMKQMYIGDSEVNALVMAALTGSVLIWWIGIAGGKRKLIKEKYMFVSLVLGGVFPSYIIAYQIMRKEPVIWILSFCIESSNNVRVLIYWISLLIIGIGIIHPERAGFSTVIGRKYYHGLAGGIFGVGYIWASDLTRIGSAAAMGLLLFGEVARINGFGDKGKELIRKYASALINERDSGDIVVSHLYLLIGCSAPGWISESNDPNVLPFMIGGVISLCVFDSIAAIVGEIWGRNKWHEMNRTKEGSFVGMITSCATAIAFGTNDTLAIVAVGLSTMLEAFTEQDDNLVLPMMYCAILRAFPEALIAYNDWINESTGIKLLLN